MDRRSLTRETGSTPDGAMRYVLVAAVAGLVIVTALTLVAGTSLAFTGGVDWVANGVKVEMNNGGDVDAVVFGDRDIVSGDGITLEYEGFEQPNRNVTVSVEVKGKSDGDPTGWDGGNVTETGWETVAQENVTVADLSGSVEYNWSDAFGAKMPVNITGEHSEIRPVDFEVDEVGGTRVRELSVRIRAQAPAEGVTSQRTTVAKVIVSNVGVDINFETDSTTTPDGFVPDTGGAYGERNGLTYGWSDVNTETRERGSTPDTKNDTLVHFADENIPDRYDSSINPNWSVSLPNGTYDVTFVAGDPDNVDSEHTFEVNGNLFQDPENNGGTTRSSNFVRYEGEVTVNDGNMTFEPPDGVFNPKLNWVRIRATDVAVPFFDVSIDDTNSPVEPGENVSVNYTVENTGTVGDTQDIELSIDGVGTVGAETQTLTSGGNVSGTLEWNTTGNPEDTYDVNVSSDNDTDSRTVVIAESFFEVEITGTNSPQGVGDTVSVDYDVTNTGAGNGTRFVDLFVNGTREDFQEVTLNASESKTGTLDWNTGPGDGGTEEVNVTTEDTFDTDTVFVGDLPLDINFKATDSDSSFTGGPAAPVPPSYINDTGETFADRNNLTYGWTSDKTGTARPTSGNDRDATGFDARNATFNQFVDNPAEPYDPSTDGGLWSIEIPDGFYDVTLVGGDPDFFDNNISVRVEDTVFVDEDFDTGTQTRPDAFLRHEGTVEVTGDELTVEPPAGTYNPKISWIRIEEPGDALYEVSITDAPNNATVGDEVTVNATVENTGSQGGIQDVNLTVDGSVEGSETVTLMNGSTTTVTFNYTVAPGDKPEIDTSVVSEDDSDTRTVTVEDAEPEFFEVAIDDAQTDGNVSETENVTVVAAVNNTGGPGSQDINFTVEDDGGNELFNDTENVSLNSASETDVTFVYETQVGDDPNVNVTVASANDTDSRTVGVERLGAYSFVVNNSRDGSVNLTGVGIRNTTDGKPVQVGNGSTTAPEDRVLLGDGTQLIPDGVTVPIDSSEPENSTLVNGNDFQETPIGSGNELGLEFERFRDGADAPVNMTGEDFVVVLELNGNETAVFEIENEGDVVFLNNTQAGQVQLTPSVKGTGNSGKYQYGLNNTGDIDVTVDGIGIRSTTANNVVRVEEGGFLDSNGNQIIDANTDIPIDSSTIVPHDPVDILTGGPEVTFEFDRFVDSGGKNGKMKDEQVTIEVRFADGSRRTYQLIP